MKPLAISMGCPGGIGPEVTLRALLEDAGEALVFGDVALLQARAATLGVDLGRLRARLVQVGPPLSADARSAGRWTKEGAPRSSPTSTPPSTRCWRARRARS